MAAYPRGRDRKGCRPVPVLPEDHRPAGRRARGPYHRETARDRRAGELAAPLPLLPLFSPRWRLHRALTARRFISEISSGLADGFPTHSRRRGIIFSVRSRSPQQSTPMPNRCAVRQTVERLQPILFAARFRETTSSGLISPWPGTGRTSVSSAGVHRPSSTTFRSLLRKTYPRPPISTSAPAFSAFRVIVRRLTPAASATVCAGTISPILIFTELLPCVLRDPGYLLLGDKTRGSQPSDPIDRAVPVQPVLHSSPFLPDRRMTPFRYTVSSRSRSLGSFTPLFRSLLA